MYTIEYAKSKEEKPLIKEPKYTNAHRKIDGILKLRYFHQKDILDKCWNIKSITIDLDDIKHIMLDRKPNHLASLYAKVNRMTLEQKLDTITIKNNSNINTLWIYEILNCEWMVNKVEKLNPSDLLKAEKQLSILKKNYEQATESRTRRNIKKEIELMQYYLDTLISKDNETGKDENVELEKQLLKK